MTEADLLYDVFSPVALRGRSASVSGTGPLRQTVAETFALVGANVIHDEEADVQVVARHGSVETRCTMGGHIRANRVEAGAMPAEAAAWAALFLVCPASRALDGCRFGGATPGPGNQAPTASDLPAARRGEAPSPGEGVAPFALYDTFSPTVLKGKVALVDGPVGTAAAALALELARAGSCVALCGTGGEAAAMALREAHVLGRRMVHLGERSPGKAVEETLDLFGRLDLLVNSLGSDRAAYLFKAAGPYLNGGATVNLVSRTAWAAFDPGELHQALLADTRRHGLRVNALGVPEGGEVSDQDIAWVTIFLASDAAQHITGECIPLKGHSD